MDFFTGLTRFAGLTGLAIMRRFAVGAGLAPALKDFFTRLTGFAGFTGLSLTGGLNPLLSSIMRRFVETRRATSPQCGQCRGENWKQESTLSGLELKLKYNITN
jgi:hypothetical protein